MRSRNLDFLKEIYPFSHKNTLKLTTVRTFGMV